ncbi:MAG: ABC transporter permease, partial [Moorea sp. SIO4A3]|nr:ABC transporter permease [Moorena sp. SIO4A3]
MINNTESVTDNIAEFPVMQDKKHLRWQWLEPLGLLSPAGIWLALLLVLPTLVIFELSLVPNIRPGDVVNPSGIDNYLRVFDPVILQVMGRSLFLAMG